MKKIIYLILIIVAAAYSATLQEMYDNASAGSFGGVNYDKLVILQGGEEYTGRFIFDGSDDAVATDIMFLGLTTSDDKSAVINLEGEEILYKGVSSTLDMHNLVIKNGLVKFETIPYGADALPSPKSKISRCTFINSHGAAIYSDNMSEKGLEFSQNVFLSTEDAGWETQYGNWLPDGVAVLSYIYAAESYIPDGGFGKIHDNLSYDCTFEKEYGDGVVHSSDFWKTCVSCGGGEQNSIEWSDEEQHNFWNNQSGIDPQLQNPDGGLYYATNSAAAEKGVYRLTNSIDEDKVLASGVELLQNYPNPFNPSTTISFNLKNSGKLKLSVFNSKGESVASLLDGNYAAGVHKVDFNAVNMNSGVYYYTIETAVGKMTKKMLLVK